MAVFLYELKSRAEMIEAELDRLVPIKDCPQGQIYEAMRYSLLGGGKRLRGFLALVCCGIACGDEKKALPFAAALEMVHAYSLIHDDLPAMDNDELRRGQPTCHKVYGEAMAILAGDALLNSAFEVIIEDENLSLPIKMEGLQILAKASGCRGMIGGQVVDILSEGKQIDEQMLQYMHRHKTGALIEAAGLCGAVCGGADKNLMELLSCYLQKIGLAFQVQDDILDIEGDPMKIGKPMHSDEGQDKSTFVSILGMDMAKDAVAQLTREAVALAERINEKGLILKQLAYYLQERTF